MSEAKPRAHVDLSVFLQQAITIIAFDYGTQKTGVAVGSTLLATSQPLSLIPMKEGVPNASLLQATLSTWTPQLILVGLPLNMDDSENELCLRAAKFARRIHANTLIPVYMLDERLTSKEARTQAQHAQAANHRRAKPVSKDPIDSIAACLLLDQFYTSPTGFKP